MICQYHAPIDFNGYKMWVDIPFFATRDEYNRWYKDICEWVKKIHQEGK